AEDRFGVFAVGDEVGDGGQEGLRSFFRRRWWKILGEWMLLQDASRAGQRRHRVRLAVSCLLGLCRLVRLFLRLDLLPEADHISRILSRHIPEDMWMPPDDLPGDGVVDVFQGERAGFLG